MTTTGIQRIEFNPERDLLGKTIMRNRAGRHCPVGFKGL